MSLKVSRQFTMTIGAKIYALIALSFVGLIGVAALDSSELAATLKQMEANHEARMQNRANQAPPSPAAAEQ